MRNKFFEEWISKRREVFLFSMITLFIIVLIMLMGKADLEDKILPYTSHISNRDELQIISDFTSGMTIQQSFVSPQNFDFLTLSFSDHDQSIEGKTAVLIYEQSSKVVLLYRELENSAIHYGTPVNISFEEIGGGKAEQVYEITLISSDTTKTALGVFGYESANNTAVINGEESRYSLSIGTHSYTSLYKKITLIILGIAGLSIVFVIAGTFWLRLKEHQMFLLLAIPFILCMLLVWPGNKVYDEERHYHTFYYYSNILLGCAEEDTGIQIRMRQCDIIDWSAQSLRGAAINGQAQDYWYYMQKMGDSSVNKSLVLVDVSSSPVVSNGTLLEYLPGTLGMTLGRLLGLNYFWMMTLTRLTAIVFYLVMCYMAIKTAPVLKMVIVFTSALPVELYQTSGLSYDGFTYCVGILLFAYILKLWNEGLKRKEWIIFGILTFVLGTCKGGVYLTLILLMLLIPNEKYYGKKLRSFSIMLMLAGISMLSSFIPTFMRWFGLGDNTDVIVNSTETVGGRYHLIYAFKEPIGFLKMFILTMIENTDKYLGQLLGYRTAWSNEAISLAVMIPFLVILILAGCKTDKDQFEIGAKSRLGIFAILVAELVGMHSIFLVETPIYSNIINGFQGRYFLLFLPCILLVFRSNGLVFVKKKEYLYPYFSMAQIIYLYFFLKIFMCA